MIKRDEHGIIVQHNADYPDQADGGDSAARTGIMALCGSKQDEDLLWQFVFPGGLVRHPFQPKWNDPKLTSRDQLIQWSSGVFKSQEPNSVALVLKYARSWNINKDVLPPDVKLYLYRCARTEAPILLKFFGSAWFFMSLLWTCLVMPENETNQMICMCSVYGKAWLRKLSAWHPNLEKSLTEYWCGSPWRDQSEIKFAIWEHLQKEIK